MPKKTKKQKILAQLHRKLQLASYVGTTDLRLNSDFVKSQNEVASRTVKSAHSPTIYNVKQAVVKPKTVNTVSTYGFVKKDLIKITIFTLFALASQGVLYFLLRTR